MRPFPPIAALRRVLAAGLLVALALPAAAHADFRELLRDACNDGKVSGTYSQADYRKALANIPADALQYTDCKDVLRAAQLSAAARQAASSRASSTGGEGDGGGPIARIADEPSRRSAAAPSSRERAALADAVSGDGNTGAPVLGTGAIGAARATQATASDIPAPLLVALVLVLSGAIAGIVLYLLPRVRERRSS